jgi:hypothetical protein
MAVALSLLPFSRSYICQWSPPHGPPTLGQGSTLLPGYGLKCLGLWVLSPVFLPEDLASLSCPELMSKKGNSRTEGITQVIESLASKCEALSSNPSTAKKKKK